MYMYIYGYWMLVLKSVHPRSLTSGGTSFCMTTCYANFVRPILFRWGTQSRQQWSSTLERALSHFAMLNPFSVFWNKICLNEVVLPPSTNNPTNHLYFRCDYWCICSKSCSVDIHMTTKELASKPNDTTFLLPSVCYLPFMHNWSVKSGCRHTSPVKKTSVQLIVKVLNFWKLMVDLWQLL